MRHRPVALIAALALSHCGPAPLPEGRAQFVSAHDLTDRRDWFGGFSGIDLLGAERFAMISDQGYVFLGRLEREDGRVAGIAGRVHTLERRGGTWPVRNGEPLKIDTEGMVLTDDALFVSVEGVHEVWRYGLDFGPPEALPRPEAFDALQDNASLEALAIDGEGRLVTLPERPARWGEGLAVWRFDAGRWRQAGKLPDRDRYSAVGLDVGPDGRLYLLERKFQGPFGFTSRVRSFAAVPGGWGDERLELRTGPGAQGNLEGIAVWSDEGGAIRLTMVSDDNFWFFQRSEIVEYAIAGRLETARAGR